MANPVSSEVPAWIWILLVIAGVIASWTDIRETRIPNWLSLPVLAGGLLYAGLSGGWGGLGDAMLGAIVTSAIFIWAYIAYSGGAGDAKLMMGFGAWLGYDVALTEMLAVSLVGFSYAVVATVFRGGIKALPYVFIGGVFQILRSVQGLFSSNAPKGHDPKKDPEDEALQSGEASQVRRDRPKGWIPFAPAILLGTVLAWVVTIRFGGFL